MKRTLLSAALMAAALLPAKAADRYFTLAQAKYLTITTTAGASYFYIVSPEQALLMEFGGGQISVGSDTFSPGDIKSIRVKNIQQFMLDEDSISFGADYAIEHGMLILRRTLNRNQWNSLVLPVSLTGKQVREAFGEETLLATVRGFREGDNAAVDYETIALDTDNVVLQANNFYAIRPSREPDVEAGRRAALLAGRPYGPLYLLPNVSIASGQKTKNVNFRSTDGKSILSQRGSYTPKDGSGVLNRKLYGGVNPIYVFEDDGYMTQRTDSVLAKAFSSWFVDLSSEPAELRFYIDGVSVVATSIDQLTRDSQARKDNERTFDLQGRQTSGTALKPGIYVRNGRKFIIK